MTRRTRRRTTRQLALFLGAAAALGWGCDDNSRSVEDAIQLDTTSDTSLPDGVDPDTVEPDVPPDVPPDEIGPDVPPDVAPDGVDPCAGVSTCATERASCTGDTLDLCTRDAAGCLILSAVDCAANGATCDDADGSGTCVGATTEFVCNDGEDDDADGLVDCADPDCVASVACGECLPDGQPSNDPQRCCNLDPDANGTCGDQGSTAELCANGTDDDGDGATDCSDSDCAADAVCTAERCTDRQDNDGDGDIDCADSDCAADPVACPACVADGDFATDPSTCCSGDPDQNLICGDQGGMCLAVGQQCDPAQTGECCAEPCKDGAPVGFPGGGGFCCAPDGADYLNQAPVPDPYVCCSGDADGNGICGGTALAEDCANGADDDNDGRIDCADPDCAGTQLCLSSELCDDGADNDGDNFADCVDPDCTGDPACPCFADGQAAVDPMQCCNGDPDQNFVCGDQGGMCSSPGDQCDPSQTGECCLEPCKDTAPLGFPGFGFCCVPDGINYVAQSPVPDPYVCCNGDTDGNGICGGNAGSEICGNGADDDGDGLVDCADSSCSNAPGCVEDCTNGQDDDGDNQTDCADSECANHPACQQCVPDGQPTNDPTQCCSGDPDQNFVCGDQGGMCGGPGSFCDPSQTGECCLEPCKDGAQLGFPGVGFCCAPDGTDYLNQSPVPDPYVCCSGDADGDGLCGGAGGAENCGNGQDDDGDGLVDCADTDCANDPGCGTMCRQPAQSCGLGIGQCCTQQTCRNGNAVGTPGQRFCCLPAGDSYAAAPAPYDQADACCNGDANNDGACD